jgi:hypothetical protein
MPIAHADLQLAEETFQPPASISRKRVKMSKATPRPRGGSQSPKSSDDDKEARASQDEQASRRMSADSRLELIARIKSGMKPISQDAVSSCSTSGGAQQAHDSKSVLLPAVALDNEGEQPKTSTNVVGSLRSAWHQGDFKPEGSGSDTTWMSTSPTTPWYTPSFQQDLPVSRARDLPPISSTSSVRTRARAASNSSLSSSFIFRAPTSPLATASHVDELDSIGTAQSERPSQNRPNRRRTFSPGSFWQNTAQDTLLSASGIPAFGRPDTFPRRSLSSFQHAHSFSGVSSPTVRSRRLSFSPDVSPIQHAPLIGRYEESILRGRMSTVPSRPLDFVAQIGVLGKGACKPSLRCPTHMTVPFPAVYYDYSNDRQMPAADGPSPYVGLVDLETQAADMSRAGSSRVRKSRSSSTEKVQDAADSGTRKRRRKPRSPEDSPHHRAPTGGYRIPEQGQLQIIIKNPNKTAVKLFLVPYDLAGMVPGTKTFIRQRAYTAGPIVDMPINISTQPVASISNAQNPLDRPVLRYLIHVNICCPSRNRFYLYKSIRVVFANRIPDGKERLRNEIQLPDPRFTVWKPAAETQLKHLSVSVPSISDLPGAKSPPHQFLNDLEMSDPFIRPSVGSMKPQRNPASRLMSFSRTPLPAILSRTTSWDAHDFPAFEPASSNKDVNYDGNVSPKSSLDPTAAFATPPPVRTTATKRTLPFHKVSPPRDRSPSRPPKKGLLALQLRDWSSKSEPGKAEPGAK